MLQPDVSGLQRLVGQQFDAFTWAKACSNDGKSNAFSGERQEKQNTKTSGAGTRWPEPRRGHAPTRTREGRGGEDLRTRSCTTSGTTRQRLIRMIRFERSHHPQPAEVDYQTCNSSARAASLVVSLQHVPPQTGGVSIIEANVLASSRKFGPFAARSRTAWPVLRLADELGGWSPRVQTGQPTEVRLEMPLSASPLKEPSSPPSEIMPSCSSWRACLMISACFSRTSLL